MRRILTVLVVTAALAVVPATAHAQTTCTRYVAVTGSDTAAGTSTEPWRTVLKAVNSVGPGDEICVRPGTYTQEVVDSSVADGTASARITLRAADTTKWPVLDGRFSLSNLSFWTVRNIKFTNPTPVAIDNVNARIVSFIGGNDVVFEKNEIYDGRYAGLLIGRASPTSAEWPMRYTVKLNYIHDTDTANFYFNPGRPSSGHLIERNRFVHSGTENLKVGWGDHCDGISPDPASTDGYGAGGTTVRYNTMVDAGSTGNFAIAEPGREAVTATRNLLVDVDSVREFHVRYDSASVTTAWPTGCLGDNVTITDTWAYGTAADGSPAGQIPFSEDYNDAPLSQARETGTVTGTDPQLDANQVPQNPAAAAYGRYAP